MAIAGFFSRRSRTEPEAPRLSAAFRAIALAYALSGLAYMIWRYGWSLNAQAIALSVLLVVAETYGYLDGLVYALTMWRPRRRVSPPPLEGVSVDVFITTYNEPEDLVRKTAEAARAIDWEPLEVYILDDGDRAPMRALAAELGCSYITRGPEWDGRKRHAKAGNVNNALDRTGGEYILILDADQIPEPAIVRRMIGYFADPELAFVQSPQSFYNLPPGDPFGSDAPLFYGPIMRGKDGWNAAFFCGSNALLRREALMQVGLSAYAEEAERAFGEALRALGARSRASPFDGKDKWASKRAIREAIATAKASIAAGGSLQAASEALGAALEAAQLSAGDTRGVGSEKDGAAAAAVAQARGIDLTRSHEALAVEAVSTLSITEDMATALRLHASGWKSAFHSEVLAHGLAPEDLGAALTQRLRWAQGTLQVLFRAPPFGRKGLSLAQKLMYSATIFSYFSGFASLVFIACPIVYLFSGVSPVSAWSFDFAIRFLPFFALNRLMFKAAADGLRVSRGEQYNLGLFPLWIKAFIGVASGKPLGFAVTPKLRQAGRFLNLVRPQIAVIILTAASLGWALGGLARGSRTDAYGILANAFWGIYNAAQLTRIVLAAVYTPPEGWNPQPPNPSKEQRSLEA